ncbi:hypothetical protein Poli38472_002702 [Pythium oligandrum]|uniref:Uncharacterized protein n=1 Tax=Pythium oligandrum TaxID=41045 RepID=A0A8K1CJA2_PYTOL|nr:hypothetical protein Poli38472_002702 [Pythium oligandrum]|eukprot:TMW63761.1 hypothetical protein Poli38472_002702 [Pythium oligandrum]
MEMENEMTTVDGTMDAVDEWTVLERVRTLHETVDVARLERILAVYRQWINPGGVDGGFALTREEIACVFDYPAQEEHVDFVLRVFGNEQGATRVDLLTLLITVVCLARGTVEDKARLVFKLVDFDVEDEIVVDELAMVIALCSDGLTRLGVWRAKLVDLDARAMAYEAFDFVGIDEYDKMNFNMFLKWLVFHPRPQALFERLQCLLSTTQIVASLRKSLEEERQKREEKPVELDVRHYESRSVLDHQTRSLEQASICVTVGPIVSDVSSSAAKFRLESNDQGFISCVLTDRLTNQQHTVAFRTQPNRPSTCVVLGLDPGRLYEAELTGVTNPCKMLIQTPFLSAPSIRILVISDDIYTNGSIEARRTPSLLTDTSITGAALRHISANDYGLLSHDMTLRMGATVAFASQLHRVYEMYQSSMASAVENLEQAVRQCIRQQFAVPDNQALLYHGAQIFSGVGLLRRLIANGAPRQFLLHVAQIVSEYEQPLNTGVTKRSAADRYLRRIPGVTFVLLDTTENAINSGSSTFVQWHEDLLKGTQWDTLAQTLEIASSSAVPPTQVVILCDAPFVWPYCATRPQHQGGGKRSDIVGSVVDNPWSFYPDELRRILRLFFGSMARNPLLRVVLLCCGKIATRTLITEEASKLCIEQLTMGHVSSIEADNGATVYRPDLVSSVLGDAYTISSQAPVLLTTVSQYSTLDIIPHPLGPRCEHAFYSSGRPHARIIVGPIIGRVTSRSARILIEVDQRTERVICTLTSVSTAHVVSAESEVDAFSPTIFKVDGLQPDSRYIISFEGVQTPSGGILGTVETPAILPLTAEWLVFHHNNIRSFLPPSDSQSDKRASSWSRILTPGMRYYNAQAASETAVMNGDTLGNAKDIADPGFNPWFHAGWSCMSDPFKHPHIAVHLGGQVDMKTAFLSDELIPIITQLCDSNVTEIAKNELLKIVRFRMQEVYRVTWGTPPMKELLGCTSSVMLLNEELDLFFSPLRLKKLLQSQGNSTAPFREAQIVEVAARLRQMAFELWQLYQNQLWVDVNEADLANIRKNSSKFAYYSTLGISRLVFMNITDELRELLSTNPRAKDPNDHKKPPSELMPPLALATTTEAEPHVGLFSNATWKLLDEALGIFGDGDRPKDYQMKLKAAAKMKQIAVMTSVDLVDVVTRFPTLRNDMVRLLERLFTWKMESRSDRKASLICSSDVFNTTTFVVRDEKVNELVTLTRLGSISEPRDLLPPSGKTPKSGKPAVIKGYFSKRFTYQNEPLPLVVSVNKATALLAPLVCRTYAGFRFLSDYRRGVLREHLYFFPPRVAARAVVGPVVGRMTRNEALPVNSGDDISVSFSVPILLEVDTYARVTCVVTDSLMNGDIRVSQDLPSGNPTIFPIHGLQSQRRYVYRFEGISNSEMYRGSFHTPSADPQSLNLVAVSSNFPTHMEESQDSLWVALHDRIKVPWCGIDAVLHLGGQVPLHEAATECVHWTRRELEKDRFQGRALVQACELEHEIRKKLRRRFQQEYHLCWGLPCIRDILAQASNWFIREVVREVVDDYQAVLMTTLRPKLVVEEQEMEQKALAIPQEMADKLEAPRKTQTETDDGKERSSEPLDGSEVDGQPSPNVPSADNEEKDQEEDDVEPHEGGDGGSQVSGGVFWQHGEIGVFICDTRNVPNGDAITCNGRLPRSLSALEHPMIGERQWQQLESGLRKKRLLVFVLCAELPLILTNAAYTEKLRDDVRPGAAQESEKSGRWKLYDHLHPHQHWVACKRQLEQLLLLLFKWKAKRSGRDIVILSGGMRVGIETVLMDKETKMSLRNFTVGPVTGTVEAFEYPTSGIACPTFIGGAKDDHFTFSHSLIPSKNYVLIQAGVAKEALPKAKPKGSKAQASPGEGQVVRSARIVGEFVTADARTLDTLHPLKRFQRFPPWWNGYVPMGKAVFWDDTIVLKSVTDTTMISIRDYLHQDRLFSGALEVFYEKYQFAETARMEELRSRHLQHFDMKESLVAVLSDVWKALPEARRQQLAYFLDPFVFDMLMTHTAPELFARQEPIELEHFCRVIREFVFNAAMLRLAAETQRDDERAARIRAKEEAKQRKEQEKLEKERQGTAAAEEKRRMDELMRSNPEEYAKIVLEREEAAKREADAKKQEKLERKKAERLQELEEEQAIAKEQKRLDKLAERDPDEYNRRHKALETRIQRIQDKKQQRAMHKARKHREHDDA